MSAFKDMDIGLQCGCYGWPRREEDLAAAAYAYERAVQRAEEDLRHMAANKRRELSHAMARLHGDWGNLVGKQQYLRKAGHRGLADNLQPAIDAAWAAYSEARAAYEAFEAAYR